MTNIRKSFGRQKNEVIFPIDDKSLKITPEYKSFIEFAKNQIHQRKLKIVNSANVEMIILYWEIGTEILNRQEKFGWGAKVIDTISSDLQKAFPGMNGFSSRNLKYMQKFAKEWKDIEIVQRTVAQIPWRSNITLLDKLEDSEERLWYASKVVQNGLSKDVLEHWIMTGVYKREGKSINNFPNSLPPARSDLATQIFKDPYIFDFLGNADLRLEKELEQKLIDHIQSFLLELGQGFAFVGRQVHLELGNEDFYLDLLFYHLELRCYIVIELKIGEFQPEYLSKLNMYMNVVDDVLRHKDDQRTIGLLLVKTKNKTVVEYSLMGHTNPIGVAEWEDQIMNSLPKELQTSLPSIDEIEKELEEGSFQ
ncbi:MAG: PDDEXK nuclease domain-containing protein [Candidatus Roizmanbacteria bacterium]